MAKTEGRTYANYVCALAPLALPGVMNIRTTKQPISKNYRGDFPPQRKNDKPLGWPVFDRRRRLPCWVEITDEEPARFTTTGERPVSNLPNCSCRMVRQSGRPTGRNFGTQPSNPRSGKIPPSPVSSRWLCPRNFQPTSAGNWPMTSPAGGQAPRVRRGRCHSCTRQGRRHPKPPCAHPVHHPKLTAEGFTEKTRELDDRATGAQEVTHWREQWAGLTNAALERAGHAVR